jgi:hypothetical protein
MTKIPYEIPAEIRDLTAKRQGGPQGLRKFYRGRSQGNHPGGRHRKRPAIERQREGTQLYRGEFEGGVRSRPEAHSHRFPPDVIRHAVWLYLRFTLSYRDVEDLLAERGLTVSNESIRRWVLKFGTIIARNLRANRPKRNGGLDRRTPNVHVACR